VLCALERQTYPPFIGTVERTGRKRKKKCNMYKQIIKSALQRSLTLCMPFPATTTPLIFSLNTTSVISGIQTRTCQNHEFNSNEFHKMQTFLQICLQHHCHTFQNQNLDLLQIIWIIYMAFGQTACMAEKLPQGYWKSNSPLSTFNTFWRPFSTTL